MIRFAKSGLKHTQFFNFKDIRKLSHHCTNAKEIFRLITYSEIKLWLFKYARLDACMYKTNISESGLTYIVIIM